MGPGDPMVSTGTMTNSFKLDGLYLYQDYVGDKVDGPFPSFKGQGYWGFNTSKGEYEGFWIDNASTMMQMEAGAVDADGKVWEMHSEFLHPGSGESMKKKTIITLIDGDHHKMETFFVSDGQPDFKNMEINYTRKS